MEPLTYNQIISKLHDLKDRGARKGVINRVYNYLVKKNRPHFESDRDEYFLTIELIKLNK